MHRVRLLLKMRIFAIISLFAVVLVSSEDAQITPRHFESPKNLVSKDISVLPRPPGVLSPGQEHAVTPGGTVYKIATVVTRVGASRLFVNQDSTNSEIQKKFRQSTAADMKRNKRKR